ncbi:MAG: RNA-binding protein, partial [Mediterranea sp.]|nr:RNA-binding protein [Mediterranea sp.]
VEVDGRTIAVSEARPRSEEAPRRNNYGGGNRGGHGGGNRGGYGGGRY